MVGKLDMERLEELVVAAIDEKEAIPIIRTNDTLAETYSHWLLQSACGRPTHIVQAS